MLLEKGFPSPIIVTWNEKLHKRDQIILNRTKEYEDIFSFGKKNSITIHQANNINDIETINYLKNQEVNIVFSIASRWIIKKHFIDEFNGLVINLHQGNLPLERGSVIYQRIMNDINIVGVTLHKISVGIDTGNILYRKIKKTKDKRPIIESVNSINIQLTTKIFEEFISDLIERNQIKEYVQDNDESVFMPQFYTEINGAIDWDWTAVEIDRFIRAFGPPMPGSFTFYKGEKIILLESEVEESNQVYHPYFFGRIVTIKDDSSIRIITKNDYLIVRRVKWLILMSIKLLLFF